VVLVVLVAVALVAEQIVRLVRTGQRIVVAVAVVVLGLRVPQALPMLAATAVKV
jgi:hypothetical protein